MKHPKLFQWKGRKGSFSGSFLPTWCWFSRSKELDGRNSKACVGSLKFSLGGRLYESLDVLPLGDSSFAVRILKSVSLDWIQGVQLLTLSVAGQCQGCRWKLTVKPCGRRAACRACSRVPVPPSPAQAQALLIFGLVSITGLCDHCWSLLVSL